MKVKTKNESLIENIEKFISKVKYGQVIVYIKNNQIAQVEMLETIKVDKKACM